MMRRSLQLLRALAAAACVASAVHAAPSPATAAGLDDLRTRARRLGKEIGELEHRLEGLRSRRAVLDGEIGGVNAEIASLELIRSDAAAAERVARAAFVEDAIEIYKTGSRYGNLALILSARDPADLELFLDIGGVAAARAETALRRAEAERLRVERTQAALDERKQRLLRAHERDAALEADFSDELDRRRRTLAALIESIERLERRARREAARAPDPSSALDRLLGGGRRLRGLPPGFAATGISFAGVASWYGPGFEGNPTASGAIFDPSKFTAASKELPLGTWLYVEHEGKGVVVLVNDRGPYVDGRVLDLSQAAAQAIGITGLGWVDAEILVKK